MSKFYSREYAAPIIDVFEDFLEKKGVKLPGTAEAKAEAGDSEEDNLAIIYGEDYDELLDNISDAFANLMREARPDIEVDDCIFGKSEIEVVNTISVDTSAGKLCAAVDVGSYGPEIGIYQQTKDGSITDLFFAEVREFEEAEEKKEPGVIHGYVYTDAYNEDYTDKFTVSLEDIEAATS